MNIFTTIADLFDVFSKEQDVIIDKDGIVEYLNDEREYLVGLAKVNLGEIKNIKSTYDQFIKNVKMDKEFNKLLGKNLSKQILDMDKKLVGSLKESNPLESFVIVINILIKAIDNILKNIDNVITGESFVINDIRVSHSLLLGMLGVIYTFSTFVGNFIYIISSSFDKDIEIRKYNLDKVRENMTSVIYICNSIANDKGRHAVFNMVADVKQKGMDFKLVATDKVGAKNVSKTMSGILGIDNVFLSLLNLVTRPILLIGETYVDMRHDYYTSIQDRKKWMESQVALINMNMANEDKSSDEYIKLSKIANYYSDKVAKYDKKLSKYFDE